MSAEIQRRFAAGDFGQMEGDEDVGEGEWAEGQGAQGAQGGGQGGQGEVQAVREAEGGEQVAWAEVDVDAGGKDGANGMGKVKQGSEASAVGKE